MKKKIYDHITSKNPNLSVNDPFETDDEFNLMGDFPFPVINHKGTPKFCMANFDEMDSIYLLLNGLGEIGHGSPQSILSRILFESNCFSPEEIRDYILNLDKVMIRMGHIPQ